MNWKRKLVGPLLIAVAVLGLALQLVLAGASTFDPAAMSALFVGVVGFFVVIWQAEKFGLTEDSKRFLRRIGLAAYGLRLAIGGLLLAYGIAMWFGGDYDTYHELGRTLSRSWQGTYEIPDAVRQRYLGLGSASSHGSRAGFYYVVGVMYYMFGESLWNTTVLMCMVGALCAFLVYAIGRDMFSERVGRIACVMVAFFPSIVLWTSQAYKDGMIIFCLLLAYRCTQVLQERLDIAHVVGLAVGLLSLYYLRGYLFYVATAPVILALTSRKSSDRRAFYNQVLGVVIVGVGVLVSGLANTLLDQLQEVDLKELNDVRRGLAIEANSGIKKDADISTPEKALLYFPVGFSYFMFAPFPWQINGLRQAITAPEVLMWWMLIPATLRGMRKAVRNHLGEASGILIFCTALTMIYSLAQGNVGTAYRQRAQMLVFFFIFAAAGLKKVHWIIARVIALPAGDETVAVESAPTDPVVLRPYSGPR